MTTSSQEHWTSLTAEQIKDEELKSVFSKVGRASYSSCWGKLTQSQFIDYFNRNISVIKLNIGDAILVYQLQYWAQVRARYTHLLTTEILRKSTPLLVVLEDCLDIIDKIFQSTLSEPGELDHNYVTALEVSCLLRQREIDIKRSWRCVVKNALSAYKEQSGFIEANYKCLLSTLALLQQHVKDTLAQYTSQDTRQPKLFQLCTKLNLTVKEMDAFNYLFIQNTGIVFGKLYPRFTTASPTTSLGGSRQSSMALAAAAFAGFTSKEMLDFFDESRPHMKQEIFEPEDEFSTLMMTNFLKIPVTILRACCGCTLSVDELYKVDKTAMGDVLTHDSPLPKPPEEGDKADDLCLGEDVGELALELEEVLDLDSDQTMPQPLDTEGGGSSTSSYTTDLEYLEENFQLIETLVKAAKAELSDESWLMRGEQRKPEAVLRELKAKARSLKAKTEQRLEATRSQGEWLPRLERLATLRGLDGFEKNVLLILTGSMVSKNLRNTGNPNEAIFGHHISIGSLIGLFCEGLREQIDSRVYFYKNSRLVSGGLVHVSDPPLHSRGNFLDSVVELDRRLLDYIVGLDTEISELVDGSDLYTPSVTLDDVSLPSDHRELLVSTLQSFERFGKTCESLGLVLKGTSKGLCLLFYGASGTGKTMTANAVASFLSKKVLLVTISAMTDRDMTKDLLCFLFREAKIHNAILFFDECETLFETRENRSNQALGILLTEIEQYEGIIVLATNRHQDLDEAMHRRIHMSLPFNVPDYTLRQEIWKSHVPSTICAPDIDWTNLAISHELTGGLISNAVLSAISSALATTTNDEDLVLTEKCLHYGAKQQLRGLLEMVDFERRVIPMFGLSDLVLTPEVTAVVELVLKAGKTQKFLSAQWGFGSGGNCAEAAGISVLICGAPGTGKTSLAHGIAYELGQPVKEANCTELLSHTVSLNPRGSRGVAAFFREAYKANAVIVLDGADVVLSNSASSLMSGMVGCEHFTLLHQIEHYKGMVVLTSRRDIGQLDLGRLPQLRHIVELGMPSTDFRELIWKRLLPQKAPRDSNIDFKTLAQSYEFTGGDVARVICRAAESCALLRTPSVIDHSMLIQASETELKRKLKSSTFLPSMYE